MKKAILIILTVLVVLAGAYPVQAYPDKDFSSSGQINDGEYWNNVNIYGDDTVVDMFGGWVSGPITYNKSVFNMYNGIVQDQLTCRDNSMAYIYGGMLGDVKIIDSAVLNTYNGDISYLSCWQNSIVNIYGGNLSSIRVVDFATTLNLYSVDYCGTTQSLEANGGVINISAGNVQYLPLGGENGGGLLEGEYLSSGNSFIWDLYEGTYQHINIVPEPATILLLFFGGLFLRKENCREYLEL